MSAARENLLDLTTVHVDLFFCSFFCKFNAKFRLDIPGCARYYLKELILQFKSFFIRLQSSFRYVNCNTYFQSGLKQLSSSVYDSSFPRVLKHLRTKILDVQIFLGKYWMTNSWIHWNLSFCHFCIR